MDLGRSRVSRELGLEPSALLTVAPDVPPPSSEAVVRVRTVGGGRSCDCLCPYVEFLARRPVDTGGTILELADAVELGRRIFGSLLEMPSTR